MRLLTHFSALTAHIFFMGYRKSYSIGKFNAK
nr:MAG TPA: hypothetical protein [Caudoviricetes sp.]